MSVTYYSTPQEVINFTGIKYKDFGLENDDALKALIETWLLQIKSLINQHRNRDYTADVPAGIDNIALRACANMVGYAKVRRDLWVTKIDDFTAKLVYDKVFTKEILDDLKLFPAKPRYFMFRVEQEDDE